jgi:hypothetical protein
MLSPKRSGPLITSSPVKKSRLISSSALWRSLFCITCPPPPPNA